MNVVIAIDPGANGGIAVSYGQGKMLSVYPMPPTDGDVEALLSSLKQECEAEKWIICAVVEEVGGYVGGGGQPGSAMFTFGRGYGYILGVLAALKIRTELVRPQKWQKALSLGTSKSHASKTAWKNHLKERAQRLFPDIRVTLKTADALLLMEYARPQIFSAG